MFTITWQPSHQPFEGSFPDANVPVLCALLLEKLVAGGWISWKVCKTLHLLNLAEIMILPVYIINAKYEFIGPRNTNFNLTLGRSPTTRKNPWKLASLSSLTGQKLIGSIRLFKAVPGGTMKLQVVLGDTMNILNSPTVGIWLKRGYEYFIYRLAGVRGSGRYIFKAGCKVQSFGQQLSFYEFGSIQIGL